MSEAVSNESGRYDKTWLISPGDLGYNIICVYTKNQAANAAVQLTRAGGPVDHIRAGRTGSEDRRDEFD